MMPLQLLLFVLLYTTIFMHYSHCSPSPANNTHQHFAQNKSSSFVILDQHSAYAVMDLTGNILDGSCCNVKLKLGEHQQEYSLRVDTGSYLTWVNCDMKSHYKYPHPPYNPSVRNPVLCGDPTCDNITHPATHPCHRPTDKCYYLMKFGDGTKTTGEVIIDSLTIPFTNVQPSHQHPSIKIGCGIKNHHPPGTRTHNKVSYDGIIGLGKKSHTSILDQLEKLGITQPVFGHCMARPSGGYFFIGAGKPLPSSITWAPMVPSRSDYLYSAGQANLFYGTNFALTNLHTVLDSGCTYSYLKISALEAVINVINASLVGTPLKPVHVEGYTSCWHLLRGTIKSVEQVAAYFKTMVLVFPEANKVRFELPPHNYLVVPPHRDYVCLGLFDSADIGLADLNLIGEISLQDKLVVYDLGRKMIGWAPSNCERRGTNNQKRHHVRVREYSGGDFPTHHFRSNIPMRRQPPLANHTSISLHYETNM